MRNLDAINPSILRPSKFCIIGSFIFVVFILISLPLASGAAPKIDLERNVVVLFMAILLVGYMALAVASILFEWNWETKFYGVFLFCVGSISFISISPTLSILIYGNISILIKLLIGSLYFFSNFIWCRKFFKIYEKIFYNVNMKNIIFEEDEDAVYYMRSGDNILLKNNFNFSQLPRDGYLFAFLGLGIFLFPFINKLNLILGTPSSVTFLIFSAVPIGWLGVGLTYKVYLVFYFYPAKIKNFTGKKVYVDLSR
jgi:hypothetical protein